MGQVKTAQGVEWYLFGIGNTIRTAESAGVANVHHLYNLTGLEVGQTKIVKGVPTKDMKGWLDLYQKKESGNE
jgi:hypothetical protein